MFTTLIKHEARLQTKTLLAMLGIAVALFATGFVLAVLRLPVFASLGVLMAFGAGAAVTFAVPLYLLWRYAQSMYGREGYLTHALPVRPATLYWAKATWAFGVWLVAALVTVTMWLGALLAQQLASGGTVHAFVVTVRENLAALPANALVMFVGWLLLGLLTYVLQFGWIVTFGMEERFRSFGWGGPVVVWFVAYLVMQVAMVLGLFLIPLGMNHDLQFVFEPLLPRMTGLFDNQNLGFVPLGWLPVLLATIPVYIIWTLRSLQSHTSLR